MIDTIIQEPDSNVQIGFIILNSFAQGIEIHFRVYQDKFIQVYAYIYIIQPGIRVENINYLQAIKRVIGMINKPLAN